MQADFSRVRFDRAKHYSGVRQQQGRVLLDADWNEQLDIDDHHDRTTARDVIGPTGAPLQAPGEPAAHFLVTPAGTDFTVAPGRFYVDGILCENESAAAASAQPHLPAGAPVVLLPGGPAPLPAPAGHWRDEA